MSVVDLPDEWRLTQAGELGTFRGGNGFPTRYQGLGHGDYPFVKVSDMNLAGNKILITEANHFVSDAVRKSLGAYAFPPNTIVFAKVGEAIFQERRRILARPTCLDNNMAGFLIEPAKADYRFVYHSLTALRLGDLVATTALPSLNGRQLRSIEIALPEDVREQRAIAAALSDTDALVSSLESLLAKKRDIKQAVMQQLLKGRTRLPGYDGEWEEKPIAEVLSVKHGKSQKEIEEPWGQYPILATGGEIGRTNTPLHNGPSVLIGRKGTIDRPQYVEGPFWTIDTLFFTEVNSNAVAKYLFYRFQLIDWRSMNEASGVPSLSATRIESLNVLLPARREQQAIAAVLSDMDTEVATLEARLAKTIDIKTAMMQQLLTGRTRLPIPEGGQDEGEGSGGDGSSGFENGRQSAAEGAAA